MKRKNKLLAAFGFTAVSCLAWGWLVGRSQLQLVTGAPPDKSTIETGGQDYEASDKQERPQQSRRQAAPLKVKFYRLAQAPDGYCNDKETEGECAARAVQKRVADFYLWLTIAAVAQGAAAVALYCSTRRQIIISDAQRRIQNTQLLIAYPPKLAIRRIRLHPLQENEPISVNFRILNQGGTLAAPVRWRVDCAVISGGHPSISITEPDKEPETLVGGIEGLGYKDLSYTSDVRLIAYNVGAVAAGERGLLFYGTVFYRDGLGRLHNTDFLRQYDHRTGRFVVLGDLDDEYDK